MGTILGNPLIFGGGGGGGLPWREAEITTFTGSGQVSETISLTNPLSDRPTMLLIWKDGDMGGISENSQGIMICSALFSIVADATLGGAGGATWGTYPSATTSYAAGSTLSNCTYDGQTKVFSGTTPANRKFVSGATYKAMWIIM